MSEIETLKAQVRQLQEDVLRLQKNQAEVVEIINENVNTIASGKGRLKRLKSQ